MLKICAIIWSNPCVIWSNANPLINAVTIGRMGDLYWSIHILNVDICCAGSSTDPHSISGNLKGKCPHWRGVSRERRIEEESVPYCTNLVNWQQRQSDQPANPPFDPLILDIGKPAATAVTHALDRPDCGGSFRIAEVGVGRIFAVSIQEAIADIDNGDGWERLVLTFDFGTFFDKIHTRRKK